MTKESDEFERMVSRAHKLLDGEDASVKWNETIPDPDNPSQARQIDVLIRKGAFLNVIECRCHRVKQDVKWIEELIGRRFSLNADGIAAVSSSGFTAGAVKKAAQYGIPLFDVVSLTDEQIQSWARSLELALYFYRFENYEVSLFFDNLGGVDLDALTSEFSTHYGLRAIFSPANQLLDDQELIVEENRKKRVSFEARFSLEDFRLHGKDVVEIKTTGVAYLERLDLSIPQTFSYGTPEHSVYQRSVFVQSYNLGETKIIHSDGRVFVSLDLTELDVPEFWQFRYCTVGSDHMNEMIAFELIAPEKLIMKVGAMPVEIIERKPNAS